MAEVPSTISTSERSELQKRSRRVAELVSRLLSHFWTANDHPAARQAQIEDWLEDLIELPIDCVEEACREWRRAQRHRPTPSDIRILAIAECQRRQENEFLALPKPDAQELSDDELRIRLAAHWGPGWGRCYVDQRLVIEHPEEDCALPSLQAPPSRDTQPGVTATERKPPAYEDPEALHRARIELGLEPMVEEVGSEI